MKKSYYKRIIALVLGLQLMFGQSFSASAAEYTPSFDDKGIMTEESRTHFINELNSIRATERKPITNSNNIKDNGQKLPPLKTTAKMNEWALTRALELAAEGKISHDNTFNGAPDPTYKKTQANMFNNPNYVLGTYVAGTENLAWSVGKFSDPIKDWDSEKITGEQDYGHYLTNVNPLANIVGFASVRVDSKKSRSSAEYYSVLVIAYDPNLKEEIEDLTSLRTSANQELNNTAKAKTAEMDKLENVDTKDLESSKKQVEEALNAAKKAVSGATSKEAIESAKNDGIKAINGIANPKSESNNNDIEANKKLAIQEIRDAAAKKKELLKKANSDASNANNLEKALNDIDTQVNNAIKSIQSAKDLKAINDQKTLALKGIEATVVVKDNQDKPITPKPETEKPETEKPNKPSEQAKPNKPVSPTKPTETGSSNKETLPATGESINVLGFVTIGLGMGLVITNGYLKKKKNAIK